MIDIKMKVKIIMKNGDIIYSTANDTQIKNINTCPGMKCVKL